MEKYYFEKAYRAFIEIGDTTFAHYIKNNIISLLIETGEFEKAQKELEEYFKSPVVQGHPVLLSLAYIHKLFMLDILGEKDRALELIPEIIELFKDKRPFTALEASYAVFSIYEDKVEENGYLDQMFEKVKYFYEKLKTRDAKILYNFARIVYYLKRNRLKEIPQIIQELEKMELGRYKESFLVKKAAYLIHIGKVKEAEEIFRELIQKNEANGSVMAYNYSYFFAFLLLKVHGILRTDAFQFALYGFKRYGIKRYIEKVEKTLATGKPQYF
jgi:tetratricopeptide (TPR) repeat protein